MSPRNTKKFEKNVFINCPFDTRYYPLLRPLLFTIAYLDFNPRIALETSDSGQTRIEKICDLVRTSKYSIHDLSRLKATKKGEFYRLNMPFELGIDYGCRRFATNWLRNKRCLILEEGAHDYRRALSDISGLDIKNHANDPIKLVQAIRNWFVETVGLKDIDGPTAMWYRFNDFTSDFNARRLAEGFSKDDLNIMPIPEYLRFIKKWIRSNP
jgi:hypothetical protein